MSSEDGTTKSRTLSPDEARDVYPDDVTLREARARYFQRTGFDDATYSDTWVKLPIGPITVAFPNIRPRKEAVRIHDLNHLVTGYGTDWEGEFSISAYELGMGMGRYWFGWFLNAGGVAGGLLRAPRKTFAAYARGRATSSSSYREIPQWDEAVLDWTVGDLRRRVALQDAVPVQTADVVKVLLNAAAGVVLHLGPVVVGIAAVVLGVVTLLR